MRTMLLVSLSFSCMLVYEMLAKSNRLAWLSPAPENGDTVYSAWMVLILRSVFFFAIPALIYANVFPMERFGYFRLNKPVSGTKVLLGVLLMLFLFPVLSQIAGWIKDSVTNQELVDFYQSVADADNYNVSLVKN